MLLELSIPVLIIGAIAGFIVWQRRSKRRAENFLHEVLWNIGDGNLDSLRRMLPRIAPCTYPLLLEHAIMHEKLHVIKFLVEECDVPFDHDKVLSSASYRKDRSIIRYFIQSGASLADMARDPKFLCSASYSGDLELCRWLLEHGADPNAESPKPRPAHAATALETAAEKGDLDIFHLLLQSGATLDVESFNDSGLSILHLAARGGNAEICRFLIDRGAAIHAKTPGGALPIHYAAMSSDSGACRLLLDCGSDFESAAKVYSWQDVFLTPIECSSCRTFRILEKAGAKYDLHKKLTWGGMTLLGMAAIGGDLELCERFISEGADVHASQGRHNETLLYIAVEGWVGHRDRSTDRYRPICSLLLQHGVVNEQEKGEQPLTLAARAGRVDIFRFLLEAGVKYDLKDRSEKLIRYFAEQSAKRGRTELLDLLYELQERSTKCLTERSRR